jgi:putative SOS response-associated peptidase YedK
MCGRMTLTRRDLDEVADELEAVNCRPRGGRLPPGMAASYRPRFNVAPTDNHPMLRLRGSSARELVPALWGLAPPGKPEKTAPLLINARAETAAVKASFREAFASRRCVIPADGFYEWEGQGPTRRPFWIRPPGPQLLLFAGLYDDRGGELRFTVLTTAANPDVAALHDRMPALLAPDQVTAWLREGPPALLRPAPRGSLLATPVSRRVNSVKNDDPGCLAPEEEGLHPQDRQLRLFPI